VSANAEFIYEKVQYLLRQATDIDSTDQTVIGKTADDLLRFVGETLEAGQANPTNPNGGGDGVVIEGFNSNDTNRLTFFDNGANSYTYPFVAAGTISFNQNLVTDTGPATYWMFYTYTERFSNTDFETTASTGSNTIMESAGGTPDWTTEITAGDYVRFGGFTDANNNGIYQVNASVAAVNSTAFGAIKINNDTVSDENSGASLTITIDKNPIDSPDAILVANNAGSDITGNISANTANFDFDYDGNVQGGRTAATDAAITIRAIGYETAQFVETTGTITRATGLSYSVVAGLERNYSNP
jgi:uncharacterized cupin superfamily protein